MVTSFLKYEKIETTDIKAKELRRVAEKMITLAKRGGLHARRQAAAVLREKEVVQKLFDEIGARFADRQGGYTRIVKTGFRAGDSAPMAVIELMVRPSEKKEKKEAKAKKRPRPRRRRKRRRSPRPRKKPSPRPKKPRGREGRERGQTEESGGEKAGGQERDRQGEVKIPFDMQ